MPVTQRKKSVPRTHPAATAARSRTPLPPERYRRVTTRAVDPNRRAITIALVAVGVLIALGVLLASFADVGVTPSQQQSSGGQGLDTGAVAALQERLRQNPSDVSAMIALGNAYYDAKQWANAIPWYEKALQVAPTNTDVGTDLGTAYLYSGDVEKAKAQWSKVLQQDPNKLEAHFNMGIMYAFHQTPPDNDSAAREWETVIRLAPSSQQAKDAQSYLQKIGKR